MADLINNIVELYSPQIMALSGLIIVVLAVTINYMSKVHRKKIRANTAIIHNKDALIQQRDSSIEKLLAIISPDFINAMKDMQEELKELLAERAKWEHSVKDLKGEKSVREGLAIKFKPEQTTWKPTMLDPETEKSTREFTQMDTPEPIGPSDPESKPNDKPQKDPIKLIEDFEAKGNGLFHKGEILGELLNVSVKAVKVMEEDQMKMLRKIYKKDQAKRMGD